MRGKIRKMLASEQQEQEGHNMVVGLGSKGMSVIARKASYHAGAR